MTRSSAPPLRGLRSWNFSICTALPFAVATSVHEPSMSAAPAPLASSLPPLAAFRLQL
jgi:hypothetical protein